MSKSGRGEGSGLEGDDTHGTNCGQAKDGVVLELGIGGSSKQEPSNETGLVESVLVEPEILTEE